MNKEQGFRRQAFSPIFQKGRIGKFITNNRCKYASCKEVGFVEKGPVEFWRDVVGNYAWRYLLWLKKPSPIESSRWLKPGCAFPAGRINS